MATVLLADAGGGLGIPAHLVHLLSNAATHGEFYHHFRFLKETSGVESQKMLIHNSSFSVVMIKCLRLTTYQRWILF